MTNHLNQNCSLFHKKMTFFGVLLSICLTINCFCLSIESAKIPNELTHIDSLRNNYLTVETNLWNVIKSGAENSFVLKRINDAYIKFFAEPFYEKEIWLTTFDPDQKVLKLEIEETNHRITALRKNYLRMNVNDLNTNQAVSLGEHGITKKSSLEKIFNITVERDFFLYIRNVSGLASMAWEDKNLFLDFKLRKVTLNPAW